MLRRAAALLLGFSLLAATGAALRRPCCSLSELARPASVASPDCCESQDCCRGEKRGPAEAALSAKAPDQGARPALAADYPAAIAGPPPTLQASLREELAIFDRPPPAAGRDTLLLISLLRI